MEEWFRTLSGSALLCFENAEHVLRGGQTQVMSFSNDTSWIDGLCMPLSRTDNTLPHEHPPSERTDSCRRTRRSAQASETQALQFRRLLEELQRWGVRLLTTSRCELGGGLNGALQLHLDSLTQRDAVALLQFEAGEQAVTAAQAMILADICGCNALALTIVGGFIACQRVTAEVLLETR